MGLIPGFGPDPDKPDGYAIRGHGPDAVAAQDPSCAHLGIIGPCLGARLGAAQMLAALGTSDARVDLKVIKVGCAHGQTFSRQDRQRGRGEKCLLIATRGDGDVCRY